MAKLCRIMDNKHNIRNISVIGHIRHGKSILADFLVVASDTGVDEAERGMTFKSTAISLCYNMSDESLKGYKGERHDNEYLVNLIDSPGHVDFSYEVTAALRMTDEAIVVVDCIDGVHFQTESVIRQTMAEGIRPVLTLNKMDQCFLELDMDGEEAYENFQKIIEDTNDILRDFQVSPEKGTVAFSAGIDGWAFTLSTFAKYYASKMSVDEETMIKRLWGDNFFDPETEEWTESRTNSPTCTRGFVMFCYDPIKDIIGACMNEKKKDSLWGGLEELEVNLTLKEKEFCWEVGGEATDEVRDEAVAPG